MAPLLNQCMKRAAGVCGGERLVLVSSRTQKGRGKCEENQNEAKFETWKSKVGKENKREKNVEDKAQKQNVVHA